jgi:secreted trypsin-like serine protease
MRLIGTVSCAYKRCAVTGYPDVYTKISAVRDWIIKITGFVED